MRARSRASAPASSVVRERRVRSTKRSVRRSVRSAPSRLTGLEVLFWAIGTEMVSRLDGMLAPLKL